MLIVSGGEKGGAGKTAIATNLAVCLAARGSDVLLIDADPQRTAAKWAERRSRLDMPWKHVRWVELRGELHVPLHDLRKRYGDVIVDVAGADSVELRTALVVADVLLSPMMPSECDTETAGELNELVGSIRASLNPRLRALVVLNHAPTHHANSEVQETRLALADFPHLVVASSVVAHRKTFRDAYRARLGVVELTSHETRAVRTAAEKAAAEIWSLYDEVKGV